MSNKSSLRAIVAGIFTMSGLVACSDKVTFRDHPAGQDLIGGSEDGSLPSDGSWQRFVEDRFLQSSRSKLDVLWVIDNSGSMAPYQEALGANISAFLDQAVSWDADLRMAVTSTDMCGERRPTDLTKVMCPDKSYTTPGLQGSISRGKIISGSDPAASEDFARLASLGSGGSSFEHGLTAAKVAVEKSLSGSNFGFVRNDSFLAVVVVSDEEDDGVGLSRPDENGNNWWQMGQTRYRFTANDLVSYLKRVKSDGMFSVSSVVNFEQKNGRESPCGSGVVHEAGREQLKASELSGGVKLDLCADQWSDGLMAMADNFAAQMASFKLSRMPRSTASIEVRVDGELMSQGWSFIEARQMIVFDPRHVPTYGAKIEVKYAY